MTEVTAFTLRPITRKSADSWIRVQKLTTDPTWVEWYLQDKNYRYLLVVLEHFQLAGWKWNRGAEFLFRCLSQALDLEDYEGFILGAARPKPGRPKANPEVRNFIKYLHAQGKKSYRMQTLVKKQFGIDMSDEAIRDILKPPRHSSAGKTHP